MGGIICDKYEKRSYMTKAMVVIAGNCLSIPLFAAICFSNSFYFAIAMLALAILTSGSYLAPAITMMQSATSPQNTGLVVSAYSFFTYIGQTLSPMLFNLLAQYFGATINPRVYGYLILGAMIVGNLTSNIYYWKAGKEYEKIM